MRSNIADYNAVVEAASKFTRSVAEGNSKYAKELFTEDACLFGFLNGKQFWQQVKSKTEAEIQNKGFKRTFGFRPAIMKWAKGQKHIQTMQYLFLPFYPLMRLMGQANNMKEIALSMLTLTRDGYHKFAIDPKDITKLAKDF